jgi:hypothetical protein
MKQVANKAGSGFVVSADTWELKTGDSGSKCDPLPLSPAALPHTVRLDSAHYPSLRRAWRAHRILK